MNNTARNTSDEQHLFIVSRHRAYGFAKSIFQERASVIGLRHDGATMLLYRALITILFRAAYFASRYFPEISRHRHIKYGRMVLLSFVLPF